MTSISAAPGYPDSIGKIEVECETTAILVVTVLCHGFKEPVANANVELTLVGDGTSGQGVADERGVVTFTIKQAPEEPGDFRLTTSHPEMRIDYDGDRFAKKIERGKAISTSVQCLCKPLELEMFLDANRDGNVDAEPTNNRVWTWGRDGEGAVLMVRTTTEYDDGDHVLERTEVQFRWQTAQDGGDRWQGSVAFEPADAVRVFAGERQGDALLDHGEGLSLRDPAVVRQADGQISIWLEATRFAERPGQEEVRITFDFDSRHPQGVARQQVAVTRIAPWIMSSDMDETVALFIIDFNAQLRIKNGANVISNDGLLETLRPWMGATQLVPIRGRLATAGRYLRDAMRFGAQTAPGGARHQSVLLRGNNGATNYTTPKLPEVDLVGRGVGYIERGDLVPSDLQTGGNMMVSPPSRQYPWGRIICGGYQKGGLGPWAPFLAAQQVQELIKIDTSWLNVGHSDEIVAFVPNCNRGGFKMLLASPRKAYELMCEQDLDAVARLRGVTDDSAHMLAWDRRVEALRAGESIDFYDEQLQRPARDGNGRMCFNRYGNDLKSKQRWLDEFVLGDPLLRAIAGTRGEEAAGRVVEAGRVALREFIVRRIEELEGNWKVGRWELLRDQGVGGADNGARQSLVQDLGTYCSDTERELEGAFDADVASTLGRVYCIEKIVSNNATWRPDHDRAAHWLGRADDQLAQSLPLDPWADIAGFVEVCREAFAYLPTIAGGLDNPTQEAPQLPVIGEVTAAVFDRLGAKYGVDIGPETVGPTPLVNNLALQIKLDKIRATLQEELGVDDEDIIEVPIVFEAAGGNALVADMVNLVQLNRPIDAYKSASQSCVCIVPRAHGPIIDDTDIFVDYFDQQLRALGITTHFVDEWYEYHLNDGEIHCGSNQLQRTMSQPWWEHEPPGEQRDDELNEPNDDDDGPPVVRGPVVQEQPVIEVRTCDICGGDGDITTSRCSVLDCDGSFSMGRVSDCQAQYFEVRDGTPRDSSQQHNHGNRCRVHLIEDGADPLTLAPEAVAGTLCRDR